MFKFYESFITHVESNYLILSHNFEFVSQILVDNSKKKVLIRVSFYTLVFLLQYLLLKSSPSGPCTPGLGIFTFFLLLPIFFIIFAGSLLNTILYNRSNYPSTLIHFLACVILYFWMFR